MALVGVIATALSLILFIIFCVAYSFKTKKCCFKHKGPAFERDTNFRIYPNDHYIVSTLFLKDLNNNEHYGTCISFAIFKAERLPPPHSLVDQARSGMMPKEQPLGIPVYSTAVRTNKPQKEPKYSLNEALVTPMNGTVTTTARRRSEPTYPLPPR